MLANFGFVFGCVCDGCVTELEMSLQFDRQATGFSLLRVV